jgi:hypothetical protein
LFIKDIIHYLFPPDQKPASIAPSLAKKKRGIGTSEHEHSATNGQLQSQANGITNGVSKAPYPYDTEAEPGNPTVIPEDILSKYHFTFLIRHPRNSIPSYYRCTVPPLDAVTGFHNFMPSEAGYDELRRFFDYLRSSGQIGPRIAGRQPENDADAATKVDICVIDADDLLDNPAGIIQAYCKTIGLDYHPTMLEWDTKTDHEQAVEAFQKWKGFHEDAIESTDLKPRTRVSAILVALENPVIQLANPFPEGKAKYPTRGRRKVGREVRARSSQGDSGYRGCQPCRL